MDNLMDGTTAEQSDSDSGESWTLLEPVAGGDEVLYSLETVAQNDTAVASEKDEDTDGISIISESEPESTPEHLNYEETPIMVDNCPTDTTTHTFFSVPNASNINELTHKESMGCEDFLGDTSGKLKTYVHRRNKKLSTVLNIIVLGSVITAAGVAIGHMWGVRDDCAQPTTSSVNKILSNLYKLQEENTYLRNKLKDLTLANNLQIHQRKNDIDKPIAFKNKCKKVFEESLNNKNAIKSTKCVESEDFEKTLHDHLTEPAFEQDFVTDLNKLKTFYKQNKSWLDVEVARRLKDDELSYRAMKQTMKANKINDKKVKTKVNPKPIDPPIDIVPKEPKGSKPKELTDQIDPAKSKIVSYADSLKSENPKAHKVTKQNFENNSRLNIVRRRKPKEASEHVVDNISDDEITKDNRFTEHKHKIERKKHDRYRSHKKLKSKNKYEQWQMKGGIMKDYDDLSVTTSQSTVASDNDNTVTVPNEQAKPDIYSKEVTKDDLSPSHIKHKRNKNVLKREINLNQDDWYDKRVFQRMEARRKLDREMFGDKTPNNAGWYFRRMKKREQCRANPDNGTYRTITKRKMNFKTKH